MARYDPDNHAVFSLDRQIAGLGLLTAAFGTLVFAPHVHEEMVIAVTQAGAGRCVTRGTASVGTPHTSFDFEIGETTEILVKPGSTGNVTLPGDGLWFLPKVLALIGLAWLAVSLAILLLLRVTVWRERTAT